ASWRSIRVLVSTSCSSHSTPMVAPREGFQLMATGYLHGPQPGGTGLAMTTGRSRPHAPRYLAGLAGLTGLAVPGQSVRVGWLVSAPYLAQRVAHLTHGGAGLQRGPQRVQHVGGALGRGAQLVQAALDRRVVAAGPQRGQPGGLRLLDGRVH